MPLVLRWTLLLVARCALVVVGACIVDGALAYSLGQGTVLAWWQRLATGGALLLGMGMAWNGVFPATGPERSRAPKRVLGEILLFALALSLFGTIAVHRIA